MWRPRQDSYVYSLSTLQARSVQMLIAYTFKNIFNASVSKMRQTFYAKGFTRTHGDNASQLPRVESFPISFCHTLITKIFDDVTSRSGHFSPSF